jgi:hypothetical protein
MTSKALMGAAVALLMGGSALGDKDDEGREHEEHEHGVRRDNHWRRHHRWQFRLEQEQPRNYYYNEPSYDPYRDYRRVPEDSDVPQDSD